MEEKFDYFMQQTNAKLEKIDQKLDQLWSFRIMIVGASLTIATICSIVVTLITLAFK